MKYKLAFSDGGHFCQNLIFSLLKDEIDLEVDQQNPDLLVYSLYGRQHRSYSCKKLCIIGENSFPNFNECDYAVSPHYMSFERHCRIPFYAFNKEYSMICRNEITAIESPEKRKFCCALITNGINADPRRDEFVKQLHKSQSIDSVGKWLNTTGWTIANREEFAENLAGKYTNPQKIALCRNYKFTLALENSVVDGYHTEKITDAFAAYSVPVYFGSSTVVKEFNPESFIRINDFSTFKDAIDRLKCISDDEYLHMLNIQNKCLVADYHQKFKTFFLDVISGPTYEHLYGNIAVQNSNRN